MWGRLIRDPKGDFDENSQRKKRPIRKDTGQCLICILVLWIVGKNISLGNV